MSGAPSYRTARISQGIFLLSYPYLNLTVTPVPPTGMQTRANMVE